jgi:cytidine deaminase
VSTAALNDEQREVLLQAAQMASEQAYAPFSKFHVGAAVLTVEGRIFTGCNVEHSPLNTTSLQLQW